MNSIIKKILTVLTTVVILSFIFVVCVCAQDTPMIINISDTVGQPGGEVTIEITAENNPGISSIAFDIAFDNCLTLKSVSFNSALGGESTVSKTLTSPVNLRWVNAFDTWDEDGVFATLVFEISSNVSNTSTNILINYDEENIYDINEKNVKVIFESGCIQVSRAGDINDDQKVNNKDVTRLMQYLANWGVNVNIKAIDVNGDKKVNNKDVTRLLQYLANWGVDIFIDNGATHVHEYSSWITVDEYMHKRTCSCSGEQITTHNWNDGEVFIDSTETTGDQLKYTCVDCGATKIVSADSSNCNYKFSTEWEYNEDYHWHKATCPFADHVHISEPLEHEFDDEHKCKVCGNVQLFEVTFVNYDNTWLGTFLVEYGKTVRSAEKENNKIPDSLIRTGYKFFGWDIDVDKTAVTEDMIVTAQYEKLYTVIFADYNGSVLKTQPGIPYGGSATAPNLNKEREINGVPYVNGHWDKSFDNITEDIVVMAVYEIKTYNIRFLMPDGKVISKETVPHGAGVAIPEFSDVFTELYYDWEKHIMGKFSDWDQSAELKKVTKDLDIYAIYEVYEAPVIAIDTQNSLTQIILSMPQNCYVYGIEFSFGWGNRMENQYDISKITNDAGILYGDSNYMNHNVSFNNKMRTFDYTWVCKSGAALPHNGIDTFTYMSKIQFIAGGYEHPLSELIDVGNCRIIYANKSGAGAQDLKIITPIVVVR